MQFLERIRVGGGIEMVGPQTLAVLLAFASEWLSTVTSAPKACAIFTPI